jgi:hypothetical protein
VGGVGGLFRVLRIRLNNVNDEMWAGCAGLTCIRGRNGGNEVKVNEYTCTLNIKL